VQPPQSVLEKIVAVRLHIDDCGADDGPLRIVPGSHRAGRLTNEQALAERDISREISCIVKRAGALVMKPLLLHASSKASGNSKRRVLHFVYGPRALPYGLKWQYLIKGEQACSSTS
jgi:ectoine hydroxylase-related dioxygenase (phytanoyl-CoA dioxygenase family)